MQEEVTPKKHLATLITAAEARIKDWGLLLRDCAMLANDKTASEDIKAFAAEWKDELRYWVNLDKSDLKEMVVEAQYMNGPLNPPYFYKH